ncbi:neurotrypsin-like isoform X1 [Argopecten irradians]|uniref:neurotrypsin-like isoform X1 n=1 Tax=Argopecten irradians TaxID=31199 RepID=UPI003717DA1A
MYRVVFIEILLILSIVGGCFCAPRTEAWNRVRLMGGDRLSGRLEIKVRGVWRSVCNRGWDEENSLVACRQLGFSGVTTTLLQSKGFEEGAGHMINTRMTCHGNETNILRCPRTTESSCTETDIVVIACQAPVSFNQSVTTKCGPVQFLCTATNTCIPTRWTCNYVDDCGDRSDEQNCEPTTRIPLVTNPFRLVDGQGPWEGRLEVKYADIWGTVCDDGFDIMAADIVCRDLGYEGARSLKKFGNGHGQIWLDEVNCVGNEISSTKCRRNNFAVNDCVHSEDVGVVCYPHKTCGTSSVPLTSRKIVGGQTANAGSWPWQASIQMVLPSGQYDHYCGGTLIQEEWVLTAAHCFDKLHNVDEFRVVLGDHRLSVAEKHEQTFQIRSVTVHDDYHPGHHEHDLAIVKLVGAANLSDTHVNTACLPRKSTSRISSAGYTCYATGWGVTEGTGDRDYLREVRLPIYRNAACRQFYGTKVTDNMMCAGYDFGGKDSCRGDSGGPLVCKASGHDDWTLVGVTSWGEGCALAQHPGVYTRTKKYVNWISEYVFGGRITRTYR